MHLYKKIHIRPSYKTKVLLSYFLVVTIPYLAVLIYLYGTMVTAAQTELLNTIEQRLNQEHASVESKIASIRRSTYHLASSNGLNEFFTANFYSDYDLIESMTNYVMPIISWLEASSEDIDGFRFFTAVDSVPENNFFIQSKNHSKEPWFLEMQAEINRKGYYYSPLHQARSFNYSSAGTEKTFSLFYRLSSVSHISPTYLEVDIKPKKLFENINLTPFVQSGFAVCVTSDGQEVTSMFPENTLQEFVAQPAFNELISEQSANREVSLGAESYYISSRQISELNSSIFCIIPKTEIDYFKNKAKFSFAYIVLLFTILILTLSYIVSSLLLKRIQLMRKAVSKMQKGDFDMHIPVRGIDEIDELATSMNIMSEKINDLINKVYKSEVRQKEAELLALQAQINPHFLFNALETFRMLAEMNELNQMADGLEALGNLLRYNITPDKRTITLKNELKVVQNYVKIQNLLLNNQIDLHINVQKEALSAKMPKMILQPLVENSVLHGLQGQKKLLTISIHAQREDDNFIVKVTDSGLGATPERIAEIQEHLENIENTHTQNSIGLWNVNQRLVLSFGAESGIQIGVMQNGGFYSRFSIPAGFTG